MSINFGRYFKTLTILVVFSLPLTSQGQSMKDEIQSIFQQVLLPTDDGGNLVLTGPSGVHGRHFIPSSVEASQATINAFSNFLSANISSFPLSSTTSGLTFDFSSGVPVSTTTSLGPIFSERAQTLGTGRLNLGISFSYLDLKQLRGVNTDKIRFTFFHDDFAGPNDVPPNFSPSGVIGDDPFGTEFDYIDLNLNMDVNATVFAFYASYGITNRFDIGVAIPYITLSLEADPVAVMNPLTVLSRGIQNSDTTITPDPTHHWGSLDDPLLTFYPDPIKKDAVGVGDIAIRAKYNFLRGETFDLAILAEYRAPTGDAEDFLGAGDPSYKGQIIASTILGNFAPHLNLGYEKRGNEFDRDEIEVYAGYDQKISETFTLAIDFIGEFEIGKKIEGSDFPESVTVQGAGAWSQFTQQVSLTNIPNYSHDHIMNASVGLKFTPKNNLMVLSNVFAPLNEGGFRSSFIPTLGLEFAF